MSKERNIKDEDLAKISGGADELAQNTEVGGGIGGGSSIPKGSPEPTEPGPGGPGQTPTADGQNPDSPIPSGVST